MGNGQKTNKIDEEIFETNPKRKNEIDKKIIKNIFVDEIFVENALKKNNEYRQNHGVEILELDEYLNKRASILAKELLINGEFNNENLLYKNCDELGMNVKLSNEILEPEILMKIWYEENQSYKYKFPEDFECNNFTQMMWKNSKKFGIGYYQSNIKNKNNNIIQENNTKKELSEYAFCYIALYYPAGNKPGEYENNVFKEKPPMINDFINLEKDANFNEVKKRNENKENIEKNMNNIIELKKNINEVINGNKAKNNNEVNIGIKNNINNRENNENLKINESNKDKADIQVCGLKELNCIQNNEPE